MLHCEFVGVYCADIWISCKRKNRKVVQACSTKSNLNQVKQERTGSHIALGGWNSGRMPGSERSSDT
jgi:hypothetical protein